MAIGVNMQGNKEVLGLWAGQAEGALFKFWLQVLTEMKNCGLHRLPQCFFCDGFVCEYSLGGFPSHTSSVGAESLRCQPLGGRT